MPGASIDLPAGTVHFREVGPADGPAVVFVHGFLVDATLWSDVPDRLAAAGLRCLVPTWPLGAHRTAMRPGADLSPRGVARVVLSFLDALEIRDVTLVGNDTGGGVCQLVLDEDPTRVARLVLTDCDAFDTFPPFPFDLLFRMVRHPAPARAALQAMRVGRLRTSRLGFGWLAHRRLTAAETLPWVEPYLTDAGVRRDVATFARAWTGRELAEVVAGLASYDGEVLLMWGRHDRFFRIDLAHRLARTFADARVVEVEDALTFLALDQPALLASEIATFVGADVQEPRST